MKNKLKILLPFLGLALLFTACTPENPKLEALMDKSALKFSITTDPSNPNKFILTSLTPDVTPYWVTPMGNSTSAIDTIDIPFPGTDTIRYSVEGAGGLASADPYVVKVTTLDSNYVSGPMWKDLTGGYGKSKTWVLDCDANGVSKYFAGPIYFAGIDLSWEWDAGWASWIMPLGNYGTMTFNLIGNANFSSNNEMLPLGSATGTFMLYPSTNQLQTNGAQVIHDGLQGANVISWYSKMTIKSLTANTMQLIVATPSEWLIYNYITLDYYETH
jgi:hypothetical protein